MEAEFKDWQVLEQKFKERNKREPKSQHYIFYTIDDFVADRDGINKDWAVKEIFSKIIEEVVTPPKLRFEKIFMENIQDQINEKIHLKHKHDLKKKLRKAVKKFDNDIAE